MTSGRQHHDAWLESVAQSAVAFMMLSMLRMGPQVRGHKLSEMGPASAAGSQDKGTAAAGSPEEGRSDAGA